MVYRSADGEYASFSVSNRLLPDVYSIECVSGGSTLDSSAPLHGDLSRGFAFDSETHTPVPIVYGTLGSAGFFATSRSFCLGRIPDASTVLRHISLESMPVLILLVPFAFLLRSRGNVGARAGE
jgi:hypothetical protein